MNDRNHQMMPILIFAIGLGYNYVEFVLVPYNSVAVGKGRHAMSIHSAVIIRPATVFQREYFIDTRLSKLLILLRISTNNIVVFTCSKISRY